MSSLAVIVPAHNEELWLPRCIAALHGQTDQAFTLYLVDNASTDATLDYMRSVAGLFPVRVLSTVEKGVGFAVDDGMRTAIAEGHNWLARTDADSAPRPTWVAEVKRALESGADVVGGWSFAHPEEAGVFYRGAFLLATGLADLFGIVRPSNHRPQYLCRYRIVQGNNMAVTANTFLRCGGHPRQPSPTDRLFVNRARTVTRNIRVTPRLRVLVSVRKLRTLGWAGLARWYLNRSPRAEENIR